MRALDVVGKPSTVPTLTTGRVPVSRRALLAAGVAAAIGLWGLDGRGVRSLAAEASAADPDRIHRDGGLVLLPRRGTLVIASDFHTRYTDFRKWLSATGLVDKLKDRDDVFGLILGDVVDAKPRDAQAEENGDTRIIDEIRQIQAKLGEAGRRLIYIQGNHEWQGVRIYQALKTQFNLNDRNRRQLIAALYASENGAYFRQFNFLERMTEEHFAYLRDLPVAVLGRNGLMAVHAGPSKKAEGTKDLIEKREAVVAEMVWGRPGEIQEGGYSLEDLAGFLKKMAAEVLVVGHTPLGSLPPDYIRNGVGVFGDRQMILATSYGSEPGEKSYLTVDLARQYARVADLRPGREIQKLEEKTGLVAPVDLTQMLLARSPDDCPFTFDLSELRIPS